jgi:hypothetical protein
MKSVLGIVVLAVVTCFPLVRATAQTKQVKATVPFAFKVGVSSLPAGTYTLTAETATHAVRIADENMGLQIIVLGLPEDKNMAGVDKLVFHKYGNQYFLHKISRANSSGSVLFPPTKAEKMARQRQDEARIPVEDPVLVALN